MIAVRLIQRKEIERRFASYRCRFIRKDRAGFELWETGWGEPFTLFPERDGSYDEWQFRQVLSAVIAPTMPDDWFSSEE